MLELKKLNAELFRVKAGRAEMEYQIALKKEEVERLELNLIKQEAAEKELELKLTTLKGNN